MTYEELQTVAINLADREGDTKLLARIPDFFLVVESRINRFLQNAEMEESYSYIATEGQREFILPSDNLKIRNIKNTSAVLSLVNQEQYENLVFNKSSMNCFVREGLKLRVNPPLNAGSTLTITYFKRIPALTPGNSNWLSTYDPDVYIHGLVAEICSFIKNFDSHVHWDNRFKQTLEEVDFNNSKSVWSGPPLIVKLG